MPGAAGAYSEIAGGGGEDVKGVGGGFAGAGVGGEKEGCAGVVGSGREDFGAGESEGWCCWGHGGYGSEQSRCQYYG